MHIVWIGDFMALALVGGAVFVAGLITRHAFIGLCGLAVNFWTLVVALNGYPGSLVDMRWNQFVESALFLYALGSLAGALVGYWLARRFRRTTKRVVS